MWEVIFFLSLFLPKRGPKYVFFQRHVLQEAFRIDISQCACEWDVPKGPLISSVISDEVFGLRFRLALAQKLLLSPLHQGVFSLEFVQQDFGS